MLNTALSSLTKPYLFEDEHFFNIGRYKSAARNDANKRFVVSPFFLQ